MAVFKHIYPSGKISWMADWRDASGKQRRKACRTKTEALEWEAKMRQDKFTEKLTGIKPIEKIKFKNFTEKFLEFSKANKKNKTYISHKLSVKYLTEHFKDKMLEDITVYDVEQYKLKRLEKVKPASLNRELACLKYMMNLADDWGMLQKNIARKIKLLREPPGRLRYLNAEEIHRLIDAAKPEYLKVYYIIAFYTGMRKSEILGLQWENVDFKNKIIHVVQQVAEDSPKSGRRREVPMADELAKILKTWKTHTDGINVFNIKDPKKAHATACKRANIENFRLHDCRHTAATIFRLAGTELDTLMEILGHSSIRMTMRYAHIGCHEKEKAASNVEYLLNLK